MVKKDIDVSVIMPAYNTQDYIAEAIDSILSQRFDGSYELLIADDNSTDSTLLIIKQYAEKYPSIIHYVHNEENRGCSSNYVNLCNSAKGKYLAFCDSDDVWVSSNKLKSQFDFLESHPEYGMCITQSIGNQCDRCVCVGGVNFIQLIKGHTDVYNSSIVMRQELYNQMKVDCKWFIENNYFFDTVWSYWFAFYSEIYSMGEPLMYYRIRQESDCRTNDPQKRYNLDKRYFKIKVAFLLQNNVLLADVLEILSSEYDYLYDNAKWKGEEHVRKSKAYKLGKTITNTFGWIKKFLK